MFFLERPRRGKQKELRFRDTAAASTMRFTAIHALALLLLLAGAAPRALAGTNCPPIKFARRDVPSACKSSSDATVCGAGGCVDQLSDLGECRKGCWASEGG